MEEVLQLSIQVVSALTFKGSLVFISMTEHCHGPPRTSWAIPVYCIGPSSSSQLMNHEAISFTPTTVIIPTYIQSTQVFNSDLSYGVQNLYLLIAIWHYHLDISKVWRLIPFIQEQHSWPNSLPVTAKMTIHSSTQEETLEPWFIPSLSLNFHIQSTMSNWFPLRNHSWMPN